ncbi:MULTISPECIES: GNAT family N-acetyltransferase [Brevibacterium]|nr:MULTISPECIES: GNAT family N-acetyltransferase [Brevibacterium]HCG56476.1 N-acetyltransferase [Brevibacterium sp.]
MTLPPWPADSPTSGEVRLRAVEARDSAMARQLSTDPYVPQTGSLPGNASASEAGAWIARQQGRHAEGAGFSFTIARRSDDDGVGHCGLWLKDLDEGRASAGYAISPAERGRGYAGKALAALTEFAWTVPGVQRVELFIEPWNAASIRTAEHAGYLRESLLPGHKMIGGQRRDMGLYVAVRPEDGGPSE